ncbi:tRNA (adenine-N1)-methyltransferase [Helcobacillus massiliensis]|uniref:tRNA (adenine-N1)-methyltransferase n=1 Tax=Helcobacillus massiliensis TaxID=521392 RepID=UPI0021A906EA|nr:tRNA (adenine-N1)-methyltransferase [Helcobacillus massiliensis]MCT1557083.1 tRNA (adenine-N1)-methyltransferase [Helcobacillus massiliensis]MCT2036182.1 tRNA (adenine-N1)-methyltransferase [Helcobacillus massiliensis]MCT2331313.1 tRNA (adenine-N1)-methyltransferase [Helcobacillus massiliensis]
MQEEAMTPRLDRTGPFVEGDKVQVSDSKGRMNTITLKADTLFHSHRGFIRHDDLIGRPDGTVITNSAGQQLQAFRPLYNDYMMAMPRGAAIIYPKDSAQILMYGDVFPGARVIEAGVGSAGLSIALLRAIGPTGSLRSIERRSDFAEVARENVRAFFGEEPAWWDLSVGDFQDGAAALAEQGERADRVVLDMLAPWECVDQAADVLEDGGVFLAYIATVTQMSRTVEALRDHGEFTEPDAWETMMRPWHLDGLAVRPVHRMNSHTGFLLTARRTARGSLALRRKQRPVPGSRDEAELNHPDNDGFGGSDSEWSAQDLGERGIAEKKSRRALRDIRQGRTR